jgi:hypothetical protein
VLPFDLYTISVRIMINPHTFNLVNKVELLLTIIPE